MDYDLILKFSTPILTVIFGLLVYIWRKQETEIKEMKKDIEKIRTEIYQINDDNQKEIQQMKTNYLARFEKVNEGIAEIKVLLMKNTTMLEDLIKEHNRIISNQGCKGQ